MKIPLLLLCTLFVLHAHQLRENYLKVEYSEEYKTCKLTIEVETRLLEAAPFIDDNRNGIVSFKELQKHQKYLFDYTKKHFLLYHQQHILTLDGATLHFHRYQDQTYMQIDKTFHNINLNALQLKYSMFFEIESTHKLLIHLDQERGDYILSSSNRLYLFSNYAMSSVQRLFIFIKHGFFHILDGLDHLLFILMILLPSVIFFSKHPQLYYLKKTIIQLLKIITVFSLAHTLTLFVSATDLYRPNTQFIESAIAFSIFTVATMNLFKLYHHVNKKIVFLFGLLHGFGFANVLEISGINTTKAFLTALLGFNLGVEVGQILIIFLLLPLLYFMAKFRYVHKYIEVLAFFAICISIYWFLQRTNLV